MAQRYRCPAGKSGRRQAAECFGKSLGHHGGRQFGVWKDNRHTWQQPLAGIRRSRSDLSGRLLLSVLSLRFTVGGIQHTCLPFQKHRRSLCRHTRKFRYGKRATISDTAPYRFDNSYGWVGISHCGIFDDGAGNWFYTSQGRFPVNVGGNEYSNAIMIGHVRSIRWDANGWPLVMPERYGAVPQAPITENEIAGDWEHLALTNSTGTQRTSETMTYDLDTHKITSGSWKNATWTFDAATQTITTSAGVVLYLQREVDWEASPRTHTIVYAAQGNQKTYWGKKLQ